MKRFFPRGSFWRGLPSIEEVFGVTEAGKGVIAALVVWLALLALILAFVYSTSPARIPFPSY